MNVKSNESTRSVANPKELRQCDATNNPVYDLPYNLRRKPIQTNQLIEDHQHQFDKDHLNDIGLDCVHDDDYNELMDIDCEEVVPVGVNFDMNLCFLVILNIKIYYNFLIINIQF